MDLKVRRSWRRQGVGAALFEQIIAELELARASTVQARVRDDRTDALYFLLRRDFIEVHRMYDLRLELQKADLSGHTALVDRVLTRGIRISTLRQEDVADRHCWAKLADLHNAVMPEWPDPDPSDPPVRYTEAGFRDWLLRPGIINDGFFIAEAGGRYIGYSGLGPDRIDPLSVSCGPTAVRPGHQGRGVASALKALALAYARQNGFSVATAQSASPAMIRVNEKFGFRRGHAEIRLVRKFSGGGTESRKR